MNSAITLEQARSVSVGRAILPPDGEDELVREYLGRAPGFFVEVGANDRVVGSQTWHLEQRGWRGVLIEPQPDLAERLRLGRRASVCEIACTSPENAGRSMTLHVNGPLSSLNRELAAIGVKPLRTIDVPTRTLDRALEESRAPAPIDFLSIDVEGHTVEVLDGADLTRWRPRLVLIEDHVTDLRVHRHMVAMGYQWFRRTGLNSWYAPEAQFISLFGRCQFVRKYYLGMPFRN